MRRIIICLMLVFFSGTAIASGSPPKIGLPQWQEIYNCAPPSSLPSSLPRVLVEGKYVYIYNDKIADKVEFSIQDIKPRKPRTVGPIDSNEKVELGRVRIPVPPTIDGKGFSIEGIDVGLFHDKRAMQPQYYYKDRSLTKHRGMAIDRERSRVTYIDAKLSKTLDQKYWSESHFDQDAINFVLLYLSAGASSDDKVKDQKCAEVTKRYLRDPNFSGLYVKLSQRITLRSLNVGVALDKKSAKSSFIMENMTGQTIPLVGGSGCMNRDYLFKTKGDWDVVHKHTTPQLFCAAFFHTFCGNCSGVVSHELQANTANPLRVQFYLAGDPNIATEVFQTNRDYSPVQVRMPNKPKLDKLDQNEKIIHDVFSKNNFEITSLNKAFGSRPNLIEVIFKDLKEEYFDDKSLLFESFRLEDNETLTKFRNKIEARVLKIRGDRKYFKSEPAQFPSVDAYFDFRNTIKNPEERIKIGEKIIRESYPKNFEVSKVTPQVEAGKIVFKVSIKDKLGRAQFGSSSNDFWNYESAEEFREKMNKLQAGQDKRLDDMQAESKSRHAALLADPSNDVAAACQRKTPKIKRGIYGCVFETSWGCNKFEDRKIYCGRVASNVNVYIYKKLTREDIGKGHLLRNDLEKEPIVTVKSSKDGFFEASLPNGEYSYIVEDKSSGDKFCQRYHSNGEACYVEVEGSAVQVKPHNRIMRID